MKTKIILSLCCQLLAGWTAAHGAGVIVSNVAVGPGDTLYAYNDGTLMNGGLVLMGYFPASVTAADIDTIPELVSQLGNFTTITSAAPGSVSAVLGGPSPGYADQADFTNIGLVTWGSPLHERTLYSIVTNVSALGSATLNSQFALLALGTFREDLPVENQYTSNPAGIKPILGSIGTYEGATLAGSGTYQTLKMDMRPAPYYEVATLSDPPAAGTTTGGGTFVEGSLRTFTATAAPNSGYVFLEWQLINEVDGVPSGTITTNGSNPVSAVIKPPTFVPQPGRNIMVAKFSPDEGDADGDGLSNYQERAVYFTDPSNPDSDSDGLGDGSEVKTYQSDPKLADTDGDGLLDGEEAFLFRGKYNLLAADTNRDGKPDGAEDFDGDYLVNLDELRKWLSDPTRADTNGEGLIDGLAVELGRDPLADNSDLVQIIRRNRGEFALHLDEDVVDLRTGQPAIHLPETPGAPLQLRVPIERSSGGAPWTRAGEAVHEEPFDRQTYPSRYYRIGLPVTGK